MTLEEEIYKEFTAEEKLPDPFILVELYEKSRISDNGKSYINAYNKYVYYLKSQTVDKK